MKPGAAITAALQEQARADLWRLLIETGEQPKVWLDWSLRLVLP